MDSKSKNKELLKLGLIILVFVAIIGSFLLYVSYPLLSTKTAVLATQPVDPFDLFRGQYVVIRYEIGSMNSIPGAEVGNNVYVSLKEDVNGTARYQSASLERPTSDNLFIRGTIKSIYGNNMQVEYGVEQYFFERGATFQTRGMEVKVKLAGDGAARIVQLIENGEPIEISYENKTLTS